MWLYVTTFGTQKKEKKSNKRRETEQRAPSLRGGQKRQIRRREINGKEKVLNRKIPPMDAV